MVLEETQVKVSSDSKIIAMVLKLILVLKRRAVPEGKNDIWLNTPEVGVVCYSIVSVVVTQVALRKSYSLEGQGVFR